MMSNAEYRRLRTRLTRAVNKGDNEKIIAEVDYAYRIFNSDGPWPDGWARWERAREDALYALMRERGSW